MSDVLRKHRAARRAARRSERAANSQAVSPPPASGSPFTRSAQQTQGSPPGGGCDAFPAAGGEGWPETPPPAAQAPRREPITPEDAPQAVEGAEGAEELQGLFAVDRQPRPPSLAEALAGGPPTAEQIDAAVERATRPRRQETLPLPPAVFARLCPGCRSLDGEHDFGPTCTLEPDPEPPRVEDQLELQPDMPPDWDLVDEGSQDRPWVMRRKPAEVPEVPAGSHEPGNLPSSLYSRFLSSLEAPGTRRAYQGDLGLFARWLGLEPAAATERLVRAGEVEGPKLVQRWLEELGAQGLSTSVRNRRLAALKAVVKFASDTEVCSWSLQIAGERSSRVAVITSDGIRYAGMQAALAHTARRFTQEQLLDLLQPQEVSCLRFTREH